MITRTGVYAIVKREGKILLVKQTGGPHRGKWDLPGGGLEVGETIEGALRRELAEEVGLSFDKMRLFDNITAVTGELYQIGLIYIVEGTLPLQTAAPQMEHAWLDPNALTSEEISPLVQQILR